MKGHNIDLKYEFFDKIKPRVDSTIGLYWESVDERCECCFFNYEFKNFESYNPSYCPYFKATYVDESYTNEIVIEGRSSGKTITWTINGYVSFSIQDLIFKLQDILPDTSNCECWSD